MIELDHPDRCHAAKCKVPAITDVLFMIPTDAYGGQRMQQRICLGHLIALRDLVGKLQRFLRIPIQMLTPEDIARARAQQQPRVVFTFNMGNPYSTGTSTTTGAFFYRQ